MALTLAALSALQILDSRGNPTLEVEARLSDGTTAAAQVPSGASTGRHEALELRDGPGGGYRGKAVSKAVAHVNGPLCGALRNRPVENQADVDRRMTELDGTANKAKLGANAILGVSCAVARAVAQARGAPLWSHLAAGREAVLPLPMINILSGGLHAGRQIEFQDFLIVPHGFATLGEALEAAAGIHRAMGELLRRGGYTLTGVADEGGWGPHLRSNEAALEYTMRAVEAAGYAPGAQVSLAVDVAASHFYRGGKYRLESERRTLDAGELIRLYRRWIDEFPIAAIEDALDQDDWEGWRQANELLGKRCLLIGDDLLATNPARLERAVRERAANAVLVKMNQIGTLTETFQVIDRAREAGFQAVVSARSGETEDAFLADLAAASGAGRIKIGSITRSERLAKYNRLLRIEAEMTAGAAEADG